MAEPIQSDEKVHGKPKLATKDEFELGVSELHDDAPKRATMQCAVVAETKVKGIHSEP
jgi:hypothetical protein